MSYKSGVIDIYGLETLEITDLGTAIQVEGFQGAKGKVTLVTNNSAQNVTLKHLTGPISTRITMPGAVDAVLTPGEGVLVFKVNKGWNVLKSGYAGLGTMAYQNANAVAITGGTITGIGNLGVGVTPAATGAAFRTVQIGSITNIMGLLSGTGASHYLNNAYFDGSDYRAIATGTVTSDYQLNREFVWRSSASVSAGAVVTFSTMMTLNTTGLSVTGNITLTTSGTAQKYQQFTNTGGSLYIGKESSVAGAFFPGAAAYANVYYDSSGSNHPHQFLIGGVKIVDINTTGLSVTANLLSFGTGSTNTPYIQHTAATLDLKGGSTGGVRILNNAGSVVNLTISDAGNITLGTSGTAHRYQQFTNTGGNLYIGKESSVAGAFFTGSSAYANCYYETGSNPHQFMLDGVKRAEVTTTGLNSTVIGATTPAAGTFTTTTVLSAPNMASSAGLSLKTGVITALPSNATDTFIGCGSISGVTTSGDFTIITRSDIPTGVRIFVGSPTPAQIAHFTSTGLNNTVIGATTSAAATFTTVGIGGAIDVNATLYVARGSKSSGSAIFNGTTYNSHFHFGSNEDTYIRGGISTSDVVIADTGRNVGIGAASPGERLSVAGNVLATGSIKSNSATAGIGYAVGAGGTVTQATSKSTGVTLNTVCGQITMHAASLPATSAVSFTLTNSAIAAGDRIIINHVSGGTHGIYLFDGRAAAGSASIVVRNLHTSALAEAIVLGFHVIKGVTS